MPEYPPLILGVDVGANGALAFLGEGVTFVHPTPDTRMDLVVLLEEYRPSISHAYVERARSSPQMGVTSAFSFGMSYERILATLTALRIQFSEVLPYTWQRGFMLKKSPGLGMSPTEKKRDHKRMAQEVFPKIKVTLQNCDALLIAEWGRRGGGL